MINNCYLLFGFSLAYQDWFQTNPRVKAKTLNSIIIGQNFHLLAFAALASQKKKKVTKGLENFIHK